MPPLLTTSRNGRTGGTLTRTSIPALFIAFKVEAQEQVEGAVIGDVGLRRILQLN